ncbi:MAG: tail fiber domain-containing protein [Verrucomicrobia bacterium]|nr:tail fiber domain-containing protein [Verrucomicrobiota bacterium]
MKTRLLSPIFRLLVLGLWSLVAGLAPRAPAATPIKDLSLTGTSPFAGTINNTAANNFLSGATATFAAGSTLTLNGALAGTPTGGTLNLSALTLTLGAQSGASLSSLNADNLASGTLPAARMPALTGDVTTTAGAVATTLATVNSNVGTYGGATQAAQVTVNAKGLVTAAAGVTVTPAVGSITGLGTGVATALSNAPNATGGVVLYSGNIGAATGTSLTLGSSGITPSATVRAVFISAATGISQPTIEVTGMDGGYGAGVSASSALSDATSTYKSMGKITWDGIDAWNSTASTQDSEASIWTTNDGVVTKQLLISSFGALRFIGYGAGTLVTDSSGNVTASSDARLKDIVGDFTTGLSAIRQLTPKRYTWKRSTKLNADDINVSLIAQDLIAAGIGEAVNTYRTVPDTDQSGVQRNDAEGKPLTRRIDTTYTVNDRAVIAALVNAIKELAAQNDALAARVTALEQR